MTRIPLLALLLTGVSLVACGDDDPAVVGGSDAGSDAATADAGADAATADTGMDDTSGADAGMDDVGEGDGGELPAEPTLTDIHDQIFVASCAGLGCHISGNAGGGINLDNDGGLRDRLLADSSVRGVPHITPGDPSLSYLYLKMTGEHFDVGGSGGRMPLSRPPVSDELTQLLADWITAGAPE